MHGNVLLIRELAKEILIELNAVIHTVIKFPGKSTIEQSSKTEVPVYDEPEHFQQITANTSDIELKDCPAYEKAQKDTHTELEQCPTYEELQSNPRRS